MNLSHLSLTRCGRSLPHVPDNQERMQAFRALQPVQFANAIFLSEGERYAREQQPDSDYDADLQDGFELKYGTAHGAD